MPSRDRWIVVGAGASGLATAFFLREAGLDSIVIERDAAPGGRIGTVQLGDRSLDSGGKNIGRRYTLFRQFASSLGAHPFEHFGLNSSQAVNGRIVTFDAASRWRTMLNLMRGTSARDVMWFGRLLWQVKRDEESGYLGSPYTRNLAHRYDHLPVSRYFTPEFCRRIIRPMSVRMNGAEPDEIYMGNFGSNVRMVTDTYEQFRQGFGPLLKDALDRYDVRLNTVCDGLLATAGRVDGIRAKYPSGATEEIRGAGVVLTTPAAVSADLLEPVLPNLARRLRSVAYYPVALIVAEYQRPVFSPGMRSLVFGEDQPLSNAAAYGLNSLNLVRYTFSGRLARRHISSSTDPEQLLRLGETSLARYLRFTPAKRHSFVARTFDLGLCAYTPYHAAFLASIGREADSVRGLHLTGDYIQGASIEACFRSARACVRRITGMLDHASDALEPALALNS